MPLRRIPVGCKSLLSSLPHTKASWNPQFAYPKNPRLVSRRFFYGYINDRKMAPQLEPFFKQCVELLFVLLWSLRKEGN